MQWFVYFSSLSCAHWLDSFGVWFSVDESFRKKDNEDVSASGCIVSIVPSVPLTGDWGWSKLADMVRSAPGYYLHSHKLQLFTTTRPQDGSS